MPVAGVMYGDKLSIMSKARGYIYLFMVLGQSFDLCCLLPTQTVPLASVL